MQLTRPTLPPRRQRGMVTAVVLLFLIATVIFALSQMLNVSASNVIDGQRQADSTAAFFLAESGLETGQAAYLTALVTGGTVTDSACTGIASSFALGRGNVVMTAVSNPSSCSGLACLDCAVRAVGTVGVATRTLTRSVDLNTQQGTFCNGPVSHNCSNSPTVTWKLNLYNGSAFNGVGVFNLAYVGKGNNIATCAVASNCQKQFDFGSPSNGQNSAGLMGNSVNIGAGSTYPIYQTMDNADRSLVEVGAIFKGTSAAPTLTGRSVVGGASYWNSNSSGNGTTGSSADTTGRVNDGNWTDPATDTCTTALSTNAQACTNWCYNGDTIVFSYAAKVPDLNARLSTVTFGFGHTQSLAMTAVAKYPVSTTAGQASDIEAEIWYARNPNLVDPVTPTQAAASPLALNASSYKGRGTGFMGVRWISSSGSEGTAVSGSVLTVGTSYAAVAGQQIRQGDTISYSAGGGAAPTCPQNSVCGTIGTQITPLTLGEVLGGRGRYNLTGALAVGTANNRVWTISSNTLTVTTCTICNIATGDAVNGLGAGRTVSSQSSGTPAGGVGTYVTAASPAATAYLAPGSALRIGTPGTTVYLPTASNQPALTTPTAMRIAVRSGAGVLASNTTVSSAVATVNAATKSFTLNTAPTTAIDDDTLCAGTCALFVPNSQTTFQIQQLTTVSEWAGAFTCLRGADIPAEPVTRSSGTAKRWSELIQ